MARKVPASLVMNMHTPRREEGREGIKLLSLKREEEEGILTFDTTWMTTVLEEISQAQKLKQHMDLLTDIF